MHRKSRYTDESSRRLLSRPTDYERNTKGVGERRLRHRQLPRAKGRAAENQRFDERFRRAWREDSDLYFSLMQHAGALVLRRKPSSFIRCGRRAGAYLRQHANQIFDALLYKKHPTLYRSRVLTRPPLDYYLAVTAVTASAALLIAVQPWLAFNNAAVADSGCTPGSQAASGTSRKARDRIEVLVTSALIPFFAVYWRLRGAWRFRVLFI